MGKMVADPGNMGPLQEWMPAALWPKVKALDQGLKRFNNLGDNMQSDTDEWLKWYVSHLLNKMKRTGEEQGRAKVEQGG
jgi:dynein heavy chain